MQLKTYEKEALLLFILLINLALASGSFQVSNTSYIETSYTPGDSLRGMLNISFQNQPVDSLFESNMEGGIKLVDFLDADSADYTCSPTDCESAYSAADGTTEKSFVLDYGKEKLLAFVLTGAIQDISNVSFDVQENNNPSCVNPLRIDILNNDDASDDVFSTKVTGNFICKYEHEKGCFNLGDVPSGSSGEVYLGKTPFCEKIKLMASEKFRLKAWLKEDNANDNPSDVLKMQLYDESGVAITNGECNLPNPSADGGDVYCDINYSNSRLRDYFVCVKAVNQEKTKYKARRENVAPCGFYGTPPPANPPSDYAYDYDISVLGASYDSFGKQTFSSTYLKNAIKSYILNRYSNNCNPSCVIPLKIISYSENPNIEISGVKISYESGGWSDEDRIYETAKASAKLNSGFIVLDLSKANITVSGSYGNTSVYLEINGQDVALSKRTITITNLPAINRVSPLITAAAVPTKFTADLNIPAGRNITKYSWNFGDDSEPAITTLNYATHSYSGLQSYTLTLEIEDVLGYTTSKSFQISVGSSIEIANSTIKKYKTRLSNLTIQISGFPSWYQTEIKKIINVETLNEELKSLEQEYIGAVTDEDYSSIMEELTSMEVPYLIKEADKEKLPFFVNPGKINLDSLKELGLDFDGTEAEKTAVATWSQNMLSMSLEAKGIKAYYDDKSDLLFNVYKLAINNKESYSGKLYLVVEPKVEFSQDLKPKDIGENAGVVFDSIPGEINFISESSLSDTNIYLSPEKNQLEVIEIEPCNNNNACEKDAGETRKNCRSDCKPWGWAVFWLVIVLTFAVATYAFLQWWYTVKYENYLFKNRNDVFNLANSIKNARSQGIQDRDIKAKLKSAGWTSEQISYVFKKADGRAIMPFDFLRLFRRKENRFPRQGL